MHFSPSVILMALLSLLTFMTGVLVPRSWADMPTGGHLLEPHIASVPRSSATLDPRSNMIKGLLFKHQSCLSVFGFCNNGQGCCPLGGDCCSSGRSPLLVHYQFHWLTKTWLGCCTTGTLCCPCTIFIWTLLNLPWLFSLLSIVGGCCPQGCKLGSSLVYARHIQLITLLFVEPSAWIPKSQDEMVAALLAKLALIPLLLHWWVASLLQWPWRPPLPLHLRLQRVRLMHFCRDGSIWCCSSLLLFCSSYIIFHSTYLKPPLL